MNTRIAKTFTRAIRSKVYEGFLDCYNDTVITSGITDRFEHGGLKDLSRCLKANIHDAGVVVWYED